MKRFQFGLERVLVYRRTQADLERAKLVAVEAELAKLKADLASIQEGFQTAVREVLPNPVDRAELGRYRMVVETLTLRQNQKIQAKALEVARHKERFVKANQAAEVLSKVKEKQKKIWEVELQKELDSLAMDSYLSRWKN